MNVNALTAIANIVQNPITELRSFYQGRNRANSMGDALENYLMDVFAGTLLELDEHKRLVQLENAFSYQGNQNNPPDFMIRNGDAIEVKKIENPGSALALNSSYPKAKLFSNSAMISNACRDSEVWEEKDILYAIGVAKGNHLSRLFFVYGVDYAASADTYERIKSTISTEVNSIPDVEFAETKEIGRVNRVDPLGITYLRIRGMWGIENPVKVFSYIYTPQNAKFNFAAVINAEKYNSFPEDDRAYIENLADESFAITDVKIKTPDNPSILRAAKLITFSR